tara:strand:- start:4465 stop:5058 length:594 start_codon:yes stop_codon:yes gene_type:complete
MNVDKLMTKLRVMLGASTEEVVEVVETKMASAELVDGTQVEVDGELEVGKVLSVVTEEGLIPAPAAIHETTDGMLITVGEAGVIESIEEKEAEATEVVEDTETEVEVALEEEVPTLEQEEAETADLLSSIAELLAPYTEQITELQKQVEYLGERFESISDEPAAKPITRTFAEEASAAKTVADARLDLLVSLRKKKK